MSDTPTDPLPLPEVDLGDGRICLTYEGGAFYRVRMPSGEVQAFPARASASPENALADLITDPPISNRVAEFTVSAIADVQEWMDTRARQDGYDSILSACTYAGPPENPFAAEGNAYLSWRSAVWSACYAALAAHQPSDPLPTLAEFRATLPAYVPPTP